MSTFGKCLLDQRGIRGVQLVSSCGRNCCRLKTVTDGGARVKVIKTTTPVAGVSDDVQLPVIEPS